MGDVITRFKLETTQYDSALRDATSRMKELMHNVQAAGGSLNDLSAKDKELARSFGTLSTGANNAKDRVKELTRNFNSLARQYNVMTAEMQKSDVGRDIASQMQVMKQRLSEAKQELYSVSSAGESFDSVLQAIGGQLGINSKLMGVLTTGTLGYAAAITAGIAATMEASKAWSDYNLELEKSSQIVSTVTGLDGGGAQKLQDGIKALSRVYDVDFRQAVEAANTLIQQFGVSGDEALQLLKDGMQGMIAGDGGKLLAMIQQYAPSFRDAGIEASQLVAIIQNSEGGLFTDQNMNAIVMGIRNIRHQTKATQEALAGLGIDGAEMTRKLNDGTMTVFEALQQVAGAIDNVGSGSDAAGAIMQNVFGRQGTMAGTKLGEAIATLNTNLEETKMQTGLVGESMANLASQNEKLNQALRDTFGYDGWQSMANGIEASLVSVLADVITEANDLRKAFYDVSNIDVFSNIITGAANALGPLGGVLDYMRRIAGIGQLTKGGIQGKAIGGGAAGVITGNSGSSSSSSSSPVTPTKPIVTTVKKGGGGKASTSWAPIAMGDFEGIGFGRSVNDVTKDIQAAQAKFNEAGDEMGRSMAKAMIEALQKEKDTIMNEGDVTKGGFADAYNHDFGKDIARLEKDRIRNDNENKATTEKTMVGELQKITGGVEGMLSGLNQLGVDIPEGLNNVVSGLSGMLSVLQSINMIVGTIQSIQTVGTFLGIFGHGGIVGKAANGMVVPGNSFSGDNLRMPVAGGGMIGVNSGEVILNEAQSGNIVNKLFSQQGGAVDVQPWVDGEKVYLGMNNTLQRKGKGEIVTTSMLRQRGIL